jgi:hypothetical protein
MHSLLHSDPVIHVAIKDIERQCAGAKNQIVKLLDIKFGAKL